MQNANRPRFRTNNEKHEGFGGTPASEVNCACRPRVRLTSPRLARQASPVESVDAKLFGQRNGGIRQRYPGRFILFHHVTLLFKGDIRVCGMLGLTLGSFR